jgi:hypothetical protein
MDVQYDPEREAFAAMKFAGRSPWSRAAAMDQRCAGVIELTRLRAPARDRMNGGALSSAPVRAREGLSQLREMLGCAAAPI